MATQPNPAALQRVIKTPGAVLMGLGSIVGTGIFVSIAIATQVAGTGIILAIAIAALLATFNGLSSAQLAAAHPVSGGTYEYGYRFLGSYFGFTAGWMFMIAKIRFRGYGGAGLCWVCVLRPGCGCWSMGACRSRTRPAGGDDLAGFRGNSTK